MAHISSRELSEWQAFASLEPFGERRGDLQAAIIAAAVVNLWSKRPVTPDKFMPDFDHKLTGKSRVEVDNLSTAEQVLWLETLNTAFGGKDLRKK